VILPGMTRHTTGKEEVTMTTNHHSDFQKKHRTEWQDFLWGRFLDQFSGVKSKGAVNAIFTNYEKRLIARRLAALALIKKGVGAREIGRQLWLSRNTISALRKNLLGSPKSYRSQRYLKGKRRDDNRLAKFTGYSWLDDLFKDIDLWELIKNPPRPRGIGLKKRWYDASYQRKGTI